MQWPNACQHGEAEKQNRESPGLQLGRKLKLRELVQVERATGDISDDDSKKNKRPTKERIQGQFHRAVLFVGRTEDRDQEIFRDNDNLVEKEEQEKIGTEKNAVRTANYEEKPEEK